MSIPTFDVKEQYTGDWTLDAYTFDFRITQKSHILIVVLDGDGVEIERVRGDDVTFLTDVTFDPILGGGTVHLIDVLPALYVITILLANDEPVQLDEYKNKTSFTLRKFESSLDYVMGAIQRLVYRARQSLRLHDSDNEVTFNPQFPPGITTKLKRVFAVNATGNGIMYGPTTDEIADAQQYAIDASASADAAAASALALADAVAGIDTPYAGFSLRYGEAIDFTNDSEALLYILQMGYLAPSISLSCSPSTAVREKGTSVAAVTMTATTTKNTDPITAVTHYRNGVLVDTEAAPLVAGGVETFTESTPFTDTMTFYSRVNDGTTNTQSNTVTYSYAYPYYSGAGVAGKTAAQVAALTKDVRVSTATLNKSFTAIQDDVFYFAYPASYGVLTSIKDASLFETFDDWTLTVANITGLDGNPISYNIYEFNNLVVAQTTNYTFAR